MWRTDTPPVGIPLAVTVNNNKLVAYYCDCGYFCLKYDSTLGVLRKQYIDGVTSWAELSLPD